MLPKLCHLNNDLEIIIIIQYIYCVVHMTRTYTLIVIPGGDILFSRYSTCTPVRILWVTTQTQLLKPKKKKFFFEQGSGLSSLGR